VKESFHKQTKEDEAGKVNVRDRKTWSDYPKQHDKKRPQEAESPYNDSFCVQKNNFVQDQPKRSS